MSRYQTVTGFVIGRQDFGEADRIIRLFTREDGRVDAVARSVRKPRAKLASRTEPFFEVEYRLVLGKNLPTIIGAELKSQQRPSELAQLELGWSILELTEHSFQIDEGSAQWYDFLRTSLNDHPVEQHPVIWLSALAKSLDQLGLHPELPIEDGRATFRIADGELVAQGGGVSLSPDYIKLWKVAREWPLDQLLKIRGAADIAVQGNDALEQFWVYHTGKHLKSRLS